MPAAVLLGAVHAQQNANEPRSFSAGFDSLSLDLRSNQSIYTNVQVTDGSITITAAEGTADQTGFDNSEWRFGGGVSISLESAVLTADSASFTFRGGELAFGELVGTPVNITDFIEEQQTAVTGKADTIRFDNDTQTAALLGQATLSIGANEYSGCDLIYNLAEKSFTSGSSECGVLFTIFPDSQSSEDDASAPQ